MKRRFIVGLAVALMMVAAACSKDSTTPAASPASQESTAGSTVAVTLQEFSVIATPSSVPAGSVTFNTTNEGPDDVHEIVIIKTDLAMADIPTDKDGAMIEDAEGLDPIDEIEDLEVGDTQDLTVTLEAGSYILVCNIVQKEPDGSMEAHYKMGMFTEFTVTGDSGATAMPTASGAAAYTATEYSFDGPDTLPAGTSDITVENVGSGDHEMVIIRLDKHQDWTEDQVVDYVKNDPQGQPSWAVPVGGLLTAKGPPIIAPGETAPVVFMDFGDGTKAPTAVKDGALEAGTYLFMCFLGSKDQPHAAMGMVKKVTVS